MDERKHTSNGVPTFDMIPMLMANLLEDNKILSAKLDAINVVLCLLQTVPVYYPYATSDKSILWEYGTKVLKFPQKSEGLLIK